MYEDIDFPPGEPAREDDPRRLLDELWREHRRSEGAQYGERYVSFSPLVERAAALSDNAWASFQRLYAREHTRRGLPAGTQVDWMERATSLRGSR